MDFISTKDATFSIMQDVIFAPITRDAAVHPLNEARESDSNGLIDGSQSNEYWNEYWSRKIETAILEWNIVSTLIIYAYKNI